MELDYYKILKVDRSINDEDLKKAYKKLAMKWHPDKNLSNNKYAEDRFKQIAEAYEVLSDPRKRAMYDQYGEEGLKGVPPPPPEGPTTFQFNPRNGDDIFGELFGYSSAFDDGLRGTGFSTSLFGDDIFSSFTAREFTGF